MSAVGELIRNARAGKRPRWSQQLLADAVRAFGLPCTRERISRFESSEPTQHDPELLVLAVRALGIADGAVHAAVIADYQFVARQLRDRLAQLAADPSERRAI